MYVRNYLYSMCMYVCTYYVQLGQSQNGSKHTYRHTRYRHICPPMWRYSHFKLQRRSDDNYYLLQHSLVQGGEGGSTSQGHSRRLFFLYLALILLWKEESDKMSILSSNLHTPVHFSDFFQMPFRKVTFLDCIFAA